MSVIISFILFVVFAIIVFFLSIGVSILKLFTKSPKNDNGRQRRRSYDSDNKDSSSNQSDQHKKVFRKEEGDYVDYEDVE